MSRCDAHGAAGGRGAYREAPVALSSRLPVHAPPRTVRCEPPIRRGSACRYRRSGRWRRRSASPVARDRGEPGDRPSGRGIIGLRLLPDPEKGLLQHVFSQTPVPDDTQDNAEKFRRSCLVKALKCRRIAIGRRRQQSGQPVCALSAASVALVSRHPEPSLPSACRRSTAESGRPGQRCRGPHEHVPRIRTSLLSSDRRARPCHRRPVWLHGRKGQKEEPCKPFSISS